MEYKRLTNDELNDFIQRVVVQLNPDLTQQVISVVLELEQYRNKIENGTLVELPCKVGTIVYQIYKDCSNCSHFKEPGWEYDCWCDFDSEESKTMFEFDGDNDCVYIIEETKFTYNHIKDFGKDLFLTKVEAEAKLNELQK